MIKRFRTEWTDISLQRTTRGIIEDLSNFYNRDSLNGIIKRLTDDRMHISTPRRSPHKREAQGVDNIGVYSFSFINHYFISTAMTNLEEALNSSGYSDISTYLIAASERFLFYFN